MSRAVLFLLGQAVPLLLGVPIAMSRRWSSLLGWAWLAAAYFVGSLVLAVTGIVLSAVGVPWTAVSVAIAGGVIAAAAATVPRSPVSPGDPRRAVPPVPALLGIVAVAGFAMLATAASLGNSVDFTFFWGPKALLFASSRGIDFRALADPFSNYGHITYPTLWPTIMACGAMVSGRFPWRLAPMLTPMWLLLSVPLVFVLLRRLLGSREAGAVTVFWYLAMTASLLFSYSGGNAEAPLVVFETVAVLALLVGGSEGPRELRVLAGLCLAGAVLTKLEGAVAATLVVAGFMLASFVSRGRRQAVRAAALGAPALGAWLLWLIVRVTHGLPVSDPIREGLLHMSLAKVGAIVPVFPKYLQAGSWGIAWLVPLVIIVLRGRLSWGRILPALMLSCGLLAFAFVYYLHVGSGVVQMIVWTLPRLAQPALSCWILAVAVAGVPTAVPEIK